MSFSTVDPIIQYTGNGSTTTFAFDHKYYDDSDIVVVLTDASDVDTIQAITTDYTLTGKAEDAHDATTGDVVMVVAPAGGGTPEKLTIYRMVDLIQSLVIGRDEGWLSLASEKQFDLIVMMIQWVMLKVDRTAQYAITNTDTPPSLESLLLLISTSLISDLTGLTTLADGDLFRIGDISDSTEEKKITAANVWAYILTKIAANAVAAKVITFAAEFDNGDSGAADTIDFGAGQKQKSTLTANCTYTFTPPAGPGNFILKVIQDVTGSRTVTWPATVKWDTAGTAPTLSTAGGSVDIISFYYDGTNYYGQAGLDFK
jgi:hypothetical protein